MRGDAGSGVDAVGWLGGMRSMLSWTWEVSSRRLCFCSFGHYFHDVVMSFVICSFALLLLVSLFRVDCRVLGRAAGFLAGRSDG